MRTAQINNYQSDFDNSKMVDFPSEIREANPTLDENAKVLEILLTHPMPYKVEFKNDDTVEGVIYYPTSDEAEQAKTAWVDNEVMVPSGSPPMSNSGGL